MKELACGEMDALSGRVCNGRAGPLRSLFVRAEVSGWWELVLEVRTCSTRY